MEDAFTRGTGARVDTPQSSFARAVRRPAAKRDVRPKRVRRVDLDPRDVVFGLRQVIHYAGFTCRSVWRRKVLVGLSFVLTFSMVVVGMRLAPRTYTIEVKMLTQHSIIIASLTNPSRVVPYDMYAPTRAAAEMVLRRDNVISLIRQTNLIASWEQTRAPILRLYDRWRARMRGHELTADEKLDDLVEQIERRMDVSTDPGSDGLVKISLGWPDPHSGYLLVERAQQSFLQARQVAETQAITEALKVLEGYAANLRKDLELTLAELTRTQARVLSAQAVMAPSIRRSSPAARALATLQPLDASAALDDGLIDPGTLVDPRLGRLKNAAAGKRAELARLEAEQKRQLDVLQGQLSVARTIYTPNHPTVQGLQESVTALRHDSPQIVRLRNELDELETQADDQAALAADRLIRATLRQRAAAPRKPVSAAPAATAVATPVQTDTPPVVGKPRADAVAEFATARLRTQLTQLHGVLDRTDAARIELEIAKGAFKHRYSVVSPAEEPSDPAFPDTRRILFAGLVASVMFALATAVGADIWGNRILEAWQMQRQLGLRVLGAARMP